MVLSEVINKNMESAKEEIIKKTIKEASKMFDKIKKSQINSSMMNSTIIHPNVRCDGCATCPVIGNRYKCTICDNFDYCESCEEKKNSEIHKHPFLKIRKPEIAPVQILCSIKDDDFVPIDKSLTNTDANYVMVEDKNAKEKTFMDKVKDTITKDIPEKAVMLEDIIKTNLKNLISRESEERKKYRLLVKNVRQNYLLENITDDQIVDALVKSSGNVDQAVCELFSN